MYVIFPVNALSKQKREMCHGMRNPRGLKVRCYASCVIDINEYLDVFPGDNSSQKKFETDEMKFC